jgi:hypothetical protein
MKKVWLIVITVIITAGIFGYGTYYYLDPKYKSEINDLKLQIDDLQSKANSTQGATIQTTSEIDHTAGWATYSDSDYSADFKYPKDWTSLMKPEKVVSDPEGPYFEINSNFINIPDATYAHPIRSITLSNFSAYNSDYKTQTDSLKAIYANKSASGAKNILLPPVNAAMSAYTTPVYIESSDGSYRGIYYFATIGQDMGTALDLIAVLTDNTNIFTLHISRGSDKSSDYMPVTESKFELYKNYVRSLTLDSTETLVQEYNSTYQYLIKSLQS